MPRFAANISVLFQEVPFLDRFSAAADAGFGGVECWFPYPHTIGELQEALTRSQVRLLGINTGPGDTTVGEWGLAGLPGRESEFRVSFEQALEYAIALEVPAIHVLAAIKPSHISLILPGRPIAPILNGRSKGRHQTPLRC